MNRVRLNPMKSFLSFSLSFFKQSPAQNIFFNRDVPRSNDPNYAQWLIENYPRKKDLKQMAAHSTALSYQPKISIITPVYNTEPSFLREMIRSVKDQAYPNWELCIADDASTAPHIRPMLEKYSKTDNRIKVLFRKENGHIAGASNSALELATGDFIAQLDHDDLLTPHALYMVALTLNQYPDADMIYSDEDFINEDNLLTAPFFKPDWSPDFFLSKMYTCHLGVYRKSTVENIRGFSTGYKGAEDYDLVLRLSRQAKKIIHIPDVLYHWRIHEDSTAKGDPEVKPYAYRSAKKVLIDEVKKKNYSGTVSDIPGHIGLYQIRYQIKSNDLVSIIIPTKDLSSILAECLHSIFTISTYPNFEVILLDNNSVEAETFALIEYWKKAEPNRFRSYTCKIPFNYSAINNTGVSLTDSEYCLFLNNDTKVITADWIEGMVEQAQRPQIGAVGAQLLYTDGLIQHAGVVVGLGGAAANCFQGSKPEDTPYYGQTLTNVNYSAVTGACLMCRRSVFTEVGGFDEIFGRSYNDVDLCLKMKEAGYRNIYLPHVKLYHHESQSIGRSYAEESHPDFVREFEYFRKKWEKYINHDPCYNPNLTRDYSDFRIRTKSKPSNPMSILSSYGRFIKIRLKSIYCVIDNCEKNENEELHLKGWAMGKKGEKVTEIQVSCNGSVVGNAQLGILRSDVFDAYPHLDNLHSGFDCSLPLKNSFHNPVQVKLNVTTEKGIRESFSIKREFI